MPLHPNAQPPMPLPNAPVCRSKGWLKEKLAKVHSRGEGGAESAPLPSMNRVHRTTMCFLLYWQILRHISFIKMLYFWILEDIGETIKLLCQFFEVTNF